MVESTELPGVLLLRPTVHADIRGSFHESWRADRHAHAGLPTRWVQDNVSRSRRGVLRGLHFQHPGGQGKLISVLHGEVFDVAVDVRRGSPTFGRWIGVDLSGADGLQLYVPPGFAHGFQAVSEEAVMYYKCTDYYQSEREQVVAWNDPALGIRWPLADPILSGKDAAAGRLAELDVEQLPVAPAAS